MRVRRVPRSAVGAGLAALLATGCVGVGFVVSTELNRQPPAIVSASERAAASPAPSTPERVDGVAQTLTTTPSGTATGSSSGGSSGSAPGAVTGGTAGTTPSSSASPGTAPGTAGSVDLAVAFAAPTAFPYASCLEGRLLTDRAGVVRGVLGCTEGLVYAELTGGRWVTQRLGVGLAPGGIADDGSATYVLYQTAPTGTAGPDLWLLRRTHAGQVTRSMVKKNLATAVSESALVAEDGRWWAVWTELNGGTGTRLWTARTLFGTQKATWTGLTGRQPSMVVSGSGVFLAYTGGYRPERNTVYTVSATTKGWGAPQTLSGGASPYADAASYPAVALVGGRVTVAYRNRTVRGDFAGVDDLVVASRSASGWSTHTLEAYASGAPVLIDSGGRPLVAWTQLVPKLSGTTWHVDATFGCLALLGADGWQTAKVPGTVTRTPALVAAAVSGGRLVALVREYPSPGLISLRQ